MSSNENANLSRSTGPIITDVLPKTRPINTFTSLLRTFESTHAPLSNQSAKTTVLAPRNSAIHDLPHKPWEDPADYERHGEVQAYAGRGGQERADANLRRFVETHVVRACPWGEGEEVETVDGRRIWWVNEGGKRVIKPDNVEVDRVAEQVANGEVWILNGVLSSR